MVCIFCSREATPSDEHVIPKALGSELTINRVCKDCNSTLGHDVDDELVNHALIQFKRAHFRLPGNSGAVPDMTRTLLGRKGTAVTNGVEHGVVVRADEDAGISDLYIVPEITASYDATTGNVALTGIMDARDADHLRKRALQALKLANVPEDLRERVLAQLSPVAGSSQLTVSYQLPLRAGDLRRPLAKIAYELGWRWFGDGFLNDPQALVLREFVRGDATEAADVAVIGDSGFLKTLEAFASPPEEHLVFLMPHPVGMQVIVKLFDSIAAAIRITTHAHKVYSYPYHPVIRIDTRTRTARDLTLIEFAAPFYPVADAVARKWMVD